MGFHHRALLALSYLTTIQRQGSDARPDDEDGELYFKKLFDNEKVADKPERLLFTAPYKICEGGCHEGIDTNLAMVFPLFLKKGGKTAFKEMYPIETRKLGQLFTTEPPQPRYTTCSSEILSANLQTKSTWFAGDEDTTPSVPTMSTGYPGYTTPIQNISDHVKIEKLNILLEKKNKRLKDLRNLLSRIYSSRQTPSRNARRYNRKTPGSESSIVWRTISMKLSDRLNNLRSRLLQRQTKPQDPNNVALKTRNKSILPIKSVKSKKKRPKKYQRP